MYVAIASYNIMCMDITFKLCNVFLFRWFWFLWGDVSCMYLITAS